jgi:hypothetical protein
VDAAHEESKTSIRGAVTGGAAFGVGEPPAAVYRFNWGAFFLSPLWGIVYGSSAVLGWWLMSLLATLLIAGLAGGASAGSGMAAASSAASVVEIAIRLWIGMNANTWLWKRERTRLEVVAGSKPRWTIVAFMAKQLKWLVVGATLAVLSVLALAFLGLSTDPAVIAARDQLLLSRAQIGMAAVWTFAEVAFAVWLAARMRGEAEAPPARSGADA